MLEKSEADTGAGDAAAVAYETRDRPACDVCGEAGVELYPAAKDYIFGVSGEWRYVRCANPKCRTVWLDPFPTPDSVSKFYQSYYTHTQKKKPPISFPVGAKRSFKHRVKSLIASLLPMAKDRFQTDLRHLSTMSPGDLLDFGCGSGRFLVEAKSCGWSVRGSELDSSAAAIAREQGIEVDIGTLEDHAYPDGRFDAVTFNNVIEHMDNVEGVLAEIRRILKPGGRLVSISPNPESPLHRKYGQYWRGLEPPRHLFLYPSRVLGRLARRAGYTKVQAFTSASGMDVAERGSRKIMTAALGDISKAPAPMSGVEKRMAQIGALFGGATGEFCVLIADK